jgi:hypothetical protein
MTMAFSLAEMYVRDRDLVDASYLRSVEEYIFMPLTRIVASRFNVSSPVLDIVLQTGI